MKSAIQQLNELKFKSKNKAFICDCSVIDEAIQILEKARERFKKEKSGNWLFDEDIDEIIGGKE